MDPVVSAAEALAHWLIQTEVGDDARAFSLVSLGRNQNVDGVADHVNAHEYNAGHRQYHEACLDQSTKGPGDHLASRTPIATSAAWKLVPEAATMYRIECGFSVANLSAADPTPMAMP